MWGYVACGVICFVVGGVLGVWAAWEKQGEQEGVVKRPDETFYGV